MSAVSRSSILVVATLDAASQSLPRVVAEGLVRY
jgi:hypothetical protein